MIIKGTVSIQIPNPAIQKWSLQKMQFEKLTKWKTEFDIRVVIAKDKLHEIYQDDAARILKI
jgi:regulator of protease activity HflC (stomatin/prohibitin superfamily)